MWRCHSNAKYSPVVVGKDDFCCGWYIFRWLAFFLFISFYRSRFFYFCCVCVCVCAKICRLICLIHHCAYRKCHRWFSVSHWRAHCSISHSSWPLILSSPRATIANFFRLPPAISRSLFIVHLFIIFCRRAQFSPPHIVVVVVVVDAIAFTVLVLDLLVFLCFHVYFIIFHFSLSIWHLYLFALDAMMLLISLATVKYNLWSCACVWLWYGFKILHTSQWNGYLVVQCCCQCIFLFISSKFAFRFAMTLFKLIQNVI